MPQPTTTQPDIDALGIDRNLSANEYWRQLGNAITTTEYIAVVAFIEKLRVENAAVRKTALS